MNYLHGLNPPVLHRDLTSKNILLDGKIAKVADFGLSKEKEAAATMTASVGALPWAAPEVFKGALFTEAADTYSYGVILWELWSGKDPQGDLAPLAYANKVAHESYRPLIPSHTPVAIKELIVRCWDGDPKKRPSFDEILKYLKAYEASHDRHGSTKDKKERREKGDKNSKKSTGRPVEPSKVPSESNLLGTYGGNPTPSVPERTNSDISLLQSYGQDIGPSAAAGTCLAKKIIFNCAVIIESITLMQLLAANDSYINSGFSTSKSQSNPEGSHDLGKSQSADQLRKLSDSELTGSGRKNDVLKGSGYATRFKFFCDANSIAGRLLRIQASRTVTSWALVGCASPLLMPLSLLLLVLSLRLLSRRLQRRRIPAQVVGAVQAVQESTSCVRCMSADPQYSTIHRTLFSSFILELVGNDIFL